MFRDKKVCVMGLGYIGLPTASLLANASYNVFGVDISSDVVNTINSGKIHIVEPDLDIFVRSAVGSGKLIASVIPAKADVFIIAVPTPFKDNFVPDLTYVEEATKSIVPYLEPNNIVILESTSPVGTTEMIAKIILELRPDLLTNNQINDSPTHQLNIYIAHCPERVLPGKIMKELVENDRIVGGINSESTEKVVDFYSTFVTGQILTTDSRTAELSKLVENSFRDVNIAFANELSMICDKLGINSNELIKLANHHPRVKILTPGCGVGGHCIAVDPWFIVDADRENTKLIKIAREQNLQKTEWVIDKIKSTASDFYNKNKREPVIACMGLSFKPDIDDLRESPAKYITLQLIKDGYKILSVEPNLVTSKDFILTDYMEAIHNADIVVYLVAHSKFNKLNISANKIVLDFCGIAI